MKCKISVNIFSKSILISSTPINPASWIWVDITISFSASSKFYIHFTTFKTFYPTLLNNISNTANLLKPSLLKIYYSWVLINKMIITRILCFWYIQNPWNEGHLNFKRYLTLKLKVNSFSQSSLLWKKWNQIVKEVVHGTVLQLY